MQDKCYTEPTKDLILFKGVSSSEVTGKSFHVIACGERFEKAAKRERLAKMSSFEKLENGSSMHIINFGDKIR